jgi:hypothetical protein
MTFPTLPLSQTLQGKNITNRPDPDFVMLNLSGQIQNTSRAYVHGAIRKTSPNVLFDVWGDRFDDLEMTELLADIFQSF